MSKPRPWTEAEEQTIREGVAAGLTDKQITAKLPGRGERGVTCKRQRMGISGYAGPFVPTLTRVVSETDERTIYAPEETEDEPIADLWARALHRTGSKAVKAMAEGIALIQLISDKPIAVTLSSDWHVSTSTPCDLAGLRDYALATAETPGAFALAVGDLYDNPIKWSKQMRDVPDEIRLVDDLFRTFGLKLLGTTDGNHDAWARQYAGLDAIKALADRNRIHYAPDELTYIVEILDPRTRERTARYVIATRHKFRRNSNLNWTHACWRYLEERIGQWPQTEGGGTLIPDVVAIGDNHLAAVEERELANGPVWAARMGPWQLSSAYGRAMGFMRCPPTAPTFILYPHRSRRIKGFASYRDAYDTLALEREATQAA